MAIYDYHTNPSQASRQFFVQPKTETDRSKLAETQLLAENGKYQEALDQLKDSAGDINLVNFKAVLLLRLHQPTAAANLLRSHIWDLATFTLKPDIPVHVQLNFATALLMAGHVAGAMEIIRACSTVDNEQASELLADIFRWEKSLSLLRWFDWKVCGIEHLKGDFPTNISLLGRFDWESKRLTISDNSKENQLPNDPKQSHDLAC